MVNISECPDIVQFDSEIFAIIQTLLDLFGNVPKLNLKVMQKNIESKITQISENELKRICDGIKEDRKIICKHNPIGTEEEILLWMLLSVLVSYLNLTEIETPCFNGKPDAETYRDAVLFVLKNRKEKDFDAEKYLDDLVKE